MTDNEISENKEHAELDPKPESESVNVVDIQDGVIYQGDTLVLSGVNLKIARGEFAYLIGKTGSGKSSLLKTLYGDLPLRKGSGHVVDFDLSKLKARKVPFLRRKLGIVFQDFQLLMDRTVNENLLFVMKATGWKDKKDMQIRCDEVLTKVGLKTKGFKMPHALSGGEQQRVVIARALINNPVLIIADEPTGNLDPETSNEIMQLIFRLNEEMNTAVVMATHNYSIIEQFPGRILRCKQGEIRDDNSLN